MSHDNLHETSPTQSREVDDLKGHLEIEDRGSRPNRPAPRRPS